MPLDRNMSACHKLINKLSNCHKHMATHAPQLLHDASINCNNYAIPYKCGVPPTVANVVLFAYS